MTAWIIFGAVVLAGIVCLFSAHIPGLRDLTSAAPLLPQEPDHARDFAATDRAGYVQRPNWDDKPVTRLPEEGR